MASSDNLVLVNGPPEAQTTPQAGCMSMGYSVRNICVREKYANIFGNFGVWLLTLYSWHFWMFDEYKY
jgi:hypothetical protein